MNQWARAGLSASVSGAVASFVTTAALAALARLEGKGAWQPTNSTSHWLHGERAGRVRRVDAKHTLTGFATHHASAMFWALPFERWLQAQPATSSAQLLTKAAGVSALAAVVDYGLTPKRFTPGWEEVLSKRSIFGVYGALALGLAAGALLTQRMREESGGADTRSDARFASRANGGARPRTHDHRNHAGAEKLYELIDDVRICMMTTMDEEGRMFSRPMYALKPDESGDLWFFTRIDSPKVHEFGPSGRVNLAFSHPGKQHYVSVSGHAEVVRDQQKIEDLWAEPMRTWFPEGTDDPRLALVRVHPEMGEYWDSPSATVMYLYGYAKAALTGKTPDELGETRKVDLGQS